MSVPYPPPDVRVVTPILELRGATDDELARLAPLARAGQHRPRSLGSPAGAIPP